MPNCCVVGCTTNSSKKDKEPGVRFYNFPNCSYEAALRERWILAINRKKPDGSLWVPSKDSRVCSKHFPQGVRNRDWSHPASVPSLFPKVYLKSGDEKKELRRAQRHGRLSTRRHSCSPASQSTVEPAVDEDNDLGFAANNLPTRDAEVQVLMPVSSLSRNPPFSIFETHRFSDTDVAVQCDICTRKIMKDVACGGMESLIKTGFTGIGSITTEQQLKSVSGVGFEIFNVLCGMIDRRISVHVSNESAVLLFLMKLKLNVSYIALGALFQLSRFTTARLFQVVLRYLASRTAGLIIWPSKESVSSTMPDTFKKFYPTARVIIDCTEVRCEQPKLVSHRVPMFSDYKSCHTIKFLLGITPNGFICFKSKAYGGRASDTFIVNDSGFLNNLEPNDVVLADKGFPSIETNKDNAIVVVPPFVRDGRLTEEEVLLTETIASLRIHVERAIRRLKYFGILSHVKRPLFPYMDDLIHMCCVIANFMGPLINSGDH